MTARRSLREILFGAAEAERARQGGHLTDEQAKHLVDGTAEESVERLQDHIAWCEPCADLVLDARERESDPAVTQVGVAGWTRISVAVAKELGPPPLHGLLDPARWSAPAIRTAVWVPLAACLVLFFAVANRWATSSSSGDVPAVAKSEPEPQPARTVARPDGAEPALPQPVPGTGSLALGELFPAETVRGSNQTVSAVVLDPLAPFFAVVLHTTDLRSFSAYEVIILDSDGRSTWQGMTTRTAQGTFVLGLPAAPFEPGRYRVRLYGQRDGQRTLVEAYDLRVAERTR